MYQKIHLTGELPENWEYAVGELQQELMLPKGRARIRTQVCASHTKEDIDFIVKCFIEVREEMGLNK